MKKKHPMQWTLTPLHPDYEPYIKMWHVPFMVMGGVLFLIAISPILIGTAISEHFDLAKEKS